MASGTTKKRSSAASSRSGGTSSSRRSSSSGSGKRTSRSGKSGASGRSRTGSAKTNTVKKKEEVLTDYRVGQEIRILVVAVIAILMLLGNIGLVGQVGNTVSNVLFGCFGLMAYVLPFALFFGYAFFVANRENPLIIRKTAGLILLFVFLCAFLQLLTLGFHKDTPIADLYRISAEDHTGGGFLGGITVYGCGSLLGNVGAYVLTVAGLVIAAIVLTQKPLLTEFGTKSRHAARAASLKRKQSQIIRKERRASKERRVSRRKAKEEEDDDEGEDYVDLDEDYGASPLRRVTLEKDKKKTEKTAPAPKKAEKAQESAVFAMPSFLRRNEIRFEEEESGDADTPLSADPLDLEIGGLEIPSSMEEEAVPFAEPLSMGGADMNAEKQDIPAEKPKKAKASTPEERSKGIDEIRSEIAQEPSAKPEYRLPPVKLLTKGKTPKGDSRKYMMDTASKLQQTLQNFGVNVKVVNVSRGPTVTRYELQPEMGVKVSRIVNLQDDIKLNLATSEIRIEAPIPGKAAVGIEVPNKEVAPVMLHDIIDCEEFKNSRAKLPFAVGKDIGGRPIIADIEKMPHLLIAGATGSGKSVCINTLIMSILYGCTPDDVRFLMIDPKVVELKIYDGIPHLLIPVVTDAKKAAGALNWAVQEMTERYNKFAAYPGVRDIKSYNERIRKMNRELDEAEVIPSMPRIIVIVDELADLMMVASSEVEDAICRLAQLARAAGIHLIIATQRPSVNVVTGLIKANMPSRIALAVTSGIDSRTILDMNGAEKLLGKGDMLFYPQGYPKPARVQGAYVSDEDITEVVEYLTSQTQAVEYSKDVEEQISSTIVASAPGSSSEDNEHDEYFADSGRLIIEKDKASIGMLQRAFKIGFNRAARIMDQLAEAGVVGGEEGTKPRKILMTMEEFEEYLTV